jgi:hypothetical protein
MDIASINYLMDDEGLLDALAQNVQIKFSDKNIKFQEFFEAILLKLHIKNNNNDVHDMLLVIFDRFYSIKLSHDEMGNDPHMTLINFYEQNIARYRSIMDNMQLKDGVGRNDADNSRSNQNSGTQSWAGKVIRQPEEAKNTQQNKSSDTQITRGGMSRF